MASDDIVVFGVASDGSTDQWDGHKTPRGILLRWFAPPTQRLFGGLLQRRLGYPELGFDVFRAQVPDVPPLPFNDLNVPLLQGRPSWTYANVVTLSCPAGLRFEPTSLAGWWRLLITPGDPVSLKFTSPAWLFTLRTDIGTTDLTVIGKTAGVIRKQDLLPSVTTLTWRTRGIEEIELSGDGRVSLIGYHLLGDVGSWTHIAHRCLPVVDALYRCKPQPTSSEADEARSRLPAKVGAEWATRFDGPFTALLPALRRLAIGAPPAAIPPVAAVTPPVVDVQDIHLAQDERVLIDLAALDPHAARILGLAYDDPLPSRRLDGREYVYKVVGRWLGQTVSPVLTGQLPVDRQTLEREYKMEVDLVIGNRGGSHIVLRFPQSVMDASIELKVTSSIDWVANDGLGGTQAGTLMRGPAVLKFAQVLELRLAWVDPDPPVLTKLSWTPIVERIGLLPGIIAVEPGPPPGPKSLAVVIMAANAPSSITTADLDWPILINPDDSIPEGEPVSYQIGNRRFGFDPTSASPEISA